MQTLINVNISWKSKNYSWLRQTSIYEYSGILLNLFYKQAKRLQSCKNRPICMKSDNHVSKHDGGR